MTESHGRRPSPASESGLPSYVEFDGGERRLPMVQSVAELPASTDAPLPVTCWVRATGMYQMVEPGEWRLLYTLEAPARTPATEDSDD